MPTSTGVLALIKASEVTHPNPTKDRMRYKRGDFVELWGPGTAYVVPPAEPFYLIEVTGVVLTVPEIKARYEQMQMTDDSGTPTADGAPYRRRLYWVDLDSLPNANKADLAADRYTLIAWNKARSSVKNKVTGQPEG